MDSIVTSSLLIHSPRPVLSDPIIHSETVNNNLSPLLSPMTFNGVSTFLTQQHTEVFGLISWSSPYLSLTLFGFGLVSWIALCLMNYSISAIFLQLVVVTLVVSSVLHLAKTLSARSAHAAEVAARAVVQVSGKLLPESLLSIPARPDEIHALFNTFADIVVNFVINTNKILEWRSAETSGRALAYSWLAARTVHIFSAQVILTMWILLFVVGFLVSHFRKEFTAWISIVLIFLKTVQQNLLRVQTQAFVLFRERKEIMTVALPSIICILAYVFYGYYSISSIFTVLALLVAINDSIDYLLLSGGVSCAPAASTTIASSPLAGSPVTGSGKQKKGQ